MYATQGSLPLAGGAGFFVSGLGGAPDEVAGLGLSLGVGGPPVGGLDLGGGGGLPPFFSSSGFLGGGGGGLHYHQGERHLLGPGVGGGGGDGDSGW